MSITENIFTLMREKELSQKDFSKRTKIPESTISDWKNKGNTPAADKLPIIAKALGVNIYSLYGIEANVDYTLNDEEKMLIENFRKSDLEGQIRIKEYIDKLAVSFVNVTDVSTKKGADNQGVIFEQVDSTLLQQKILANKLRKLVRLDRITLDESNHTSRLNKHLFSYMDYLGMDKLEYVKKYLSTIQPFMLTEIKSQEKFENAICVIDNYYRISLYIKVDATKGEEVIVSFHENNKKGISKVNPITRQEYVYVFADSVGSHITGTDKYSINLFITRGVQSFPINVPATKYDNEGFLVRYSYINNAMIDIVNEYIEELYTSEVDYSDVTSFTSLQQLSFTSYGHDVFSNISLLMDSVLIQKDALAKQVSDAALIIYCNSLEMLDSDRKELITTLKQRFSVNSSRIVPRLLERIEVSLG